MRITRENTILTGNEFSEQEIKSVLAGFNPKNASPPSGLRPASVLIPFYPEPDGLSLIFMMRPDDPGPHGGQISFPGGSRDPHDKDDLSAALRETEEEIGVDRNAIEVWGGLNTQHTSASKYWVTPFVGQVPYPCDFTPNKVEVERLIIVPFAHLTDPANFEAGEYSWRGYDFPSYLYTYGEDVIWGLTARILFDFISLLTQGREREK